jgi:transmembrane sensor
MDASDRRRRAADEAAEWWVALQGDVSHAQREEYVDWLRESALHVAEMLRVAQVHGALRQFERWARVPTDGSDHDEGEVVPLPGAQQPPSGPIQQPRQTARRKTLVRALAAVILLGAIGLGALWFAARGQIIETQRGERREVALSDGSVVQVDPETRLRLKFEANERIVLLERGRALFHVAKNSARPFLVQADDTTVRAVGTAFAVEHQSEGVVVTVAEGRVAVLVTASESAPGVAPRPTHPVDTRRSPSATGSATPSSTRGAKDVGEGVERGSSGSSSSDAAEIFLKAGQQVTVERTGTAELVREVDSGRVLAWADGRLVFENESVEHVVQQVNRYNRIQLHVRDAGLAGRLISGTFNAADPQSFVAFLETVAAVRVQRNEAGDTVIEGAPAQ